MNKILSISIAAYNVKDYLKETLDSLVVPECLDEMEVLIVNDGSTDNTVEIASSYVKNYPSTFKLIDKDNGGWGSTVNAGIENATGKYFKLLDGDDSFNTADLPAFLKSLSECDADLVYTNYTVFDDETREVISTKLIDSSLPEGKTVSSDKLDENYMLMMHACTFKTKILHDNNVKITEKCFYTDNEYVVRALANVKTVCMKDLVIYQYRVGRTGQSVSWEGYRKHYEDHTTVCCKMLEVYNLFEGSEKMKKVLYQRIEWIIDVHYDVMLHLGKSKEYKDSLLEFDKKLNNNYPEFYSTTRRRVKIFRLTHGLIFPVYKTE